MTSRREFLAHSSLVSLAPMIPSFIAQTAAGAAPQTDDRILVVVELNGGNDGLNTLIPYADPNYPKYRKKLRLEKDIIKLDDTLALHPSMKAAAELFDSQQLAIVPGVGYPNPNRSHFRSMAIWHSARLDARDHNGQGWLGRAMDSANNADPYAPAAVFAGAGAIPAAILGRRANSIALGDQNDLKLAASLQQPQMTAEDSELDAFVRQTVDTSFQAAKRFEAANDSAKDSQSGYPNYRLARKLNLIARMIRMGGGTRLYYASQPGYDTHAMQLPTHARLLREFARSLKAFLEDMEKSGLADRVVVLAFSEFGRRVLENGSIGTDHGTSGPVFVAGKPVRAGVLAEYPALDNLDNDDLRVTVDFRSVYASILSHWLGISPQSSLGGAFAPLRVIA